MVMTDMKRGDKHRCISSLLVALLLMVVAPISAHAGDWKIFRDSNERIQFLSIGTPEKRQIGVQRLQKSFGTSDTLRMVPMDTSTQHALFKEAWQILML